MPSLRALQGCVEVAVVVTQPDRPAGRGKRLQATPVKKAALEAGTRVLTPERPGDVSAALDDLRVDVFAVASYGEILPQRLLDVPRLGALNVHPSLLPLYRGATPLQAQIRDMVAETGVTIIAMDAGMDTGDVLLQARTPLGPRETYGELEARLANLGGDLLARAVASAAAGTLHRVAQSTLATPAQIEKTLTRPLRSVDLRVDWTKPADAVAAFVRSLAPQPAARAPIGGVACKLIDVTPIKDAPREPPGTLLRIARGLAVVCGQGAVKIDRVIPASRAAMSGEAFAASL